MTPSNDDRAFEDRPLAHDYDGIDEYDNPAPTWLTTIFLLSIAFAAGYVIWFHGGGPGTSELAEFQHDWTAYQQQRASAASSEQIAVSEDILQQLAASPERVTRGKALFARTCTSCHTDNGRGLVGPNLTDEFQIHGSTRMDLYTTIRDGVPAKGMLAWGEILPYDDLLTVTSYVVTLRGTNVPNGKPPEGQRIALKTL